MLKRPDLAQLGLLVGLGFLARAPTTSPTRHPPGTALLVQRMGDGSVLFFGMMLLANLVAVGTNPHTLFGQRDE